MHLLWLAAAAFCATVEACDSCSSQALSQDVVHTRHVKRMQPEALNAKSSPKSPLEWGQINFLHTTDTHGWLPGHLAEANYGADWGDYVSFTKTMRSKAKSLGVDLLLIDSGDLHDGNGLSDVTTPNGQISNPIWENLDYDLLTIGNHELYVSEIAYEHFTQFAAVYGNKYVNSNVKILNQTSGKYETPGAQYRYFTTEHGLRIMAFGVLFDFTGNSNASKITKGADMVKEKWFTDAVSQKDPIDMFIVIGHNPIRTNASTSTMGTVYQAIRALKPDTPIQFFGGHTHIRDFFVYDNKATGIESGRYCETLGWLSINGLNTGGYKQVPSGVPTATRPAVVAATGSSAANLSLSHSPSNLKYSRRYLDWNRLTFAYHGNGSQDHTFDTQQGEAVTATISGARAVLNLTQLYGCAPQTYCVSCKPFGANGSIYELLPKALAAVVVNQTRKDHPRYIITNTGSIRFDLVQGPFTLNDQYIVSPFKNTWEYIADVPYALASQVLGILNAGPYQKKRDLSTEDFSFPTMQTLGLDTKCFDPPITHDHIGKRNYAGGKLVRRQDVVTAGYITTDDFGNDGDDTKHSAIPSYSLPNDVQANASFPTDGSNPATVDIVYVDFIRSYIINALNSIGGKYSASNTAPYLAKSFTADYVFSEYAKMNWQKNVPNCPVGQGVGS